MGDKMRTVNYDRNLAVEYAKKWALHRNPRYYNFNELGGDCTNFVSQCVFAGSHIMNYKKDTGWYYNSINDRAAAFTSAEYFWKFLVNNKGIGPRAVETELENLEIGDIISLFNGERHYHSLIVCGFRNGVPLVCAHTDDSYMRSLSTYYYTELSALHIVGVGVY